MRFIVIGGAARSGRTRLGLKSCLPPGAHLGLFSQCATLSSWPGEAKIFGNMIIGFLFNLRAGSSAGAMVGQGVVGVGTLDTIVRCRHIKSSQV